MDYEIRYSAAKLLYIIVIRFERKKDAFLEACIILSFARVIILFLKR